MGLSLSTCLNAKAINNYAIEIKDVQTNDIEIINFDINKENILTAPKTQFNIKITPKKENGYNTYKINLTNTSIKKDRAITATILVNVSDNNWTWYYDALANTECKTGKTYFEMDYKSPDQPNFVYGSWPTSLGNRPFSILPISVISNSSTKKSLVMGYFTDQPRIYRMKYTQNINDGVMRFEVDLGFSDQTLKFPNSADFTFFAEEKSKIFTFRDALKEYYVNNPKLVEDKNVLGNGKEHGAWTLWMQKNVFAPWDFEIGYNQIQIEKKVAETKGTSDWQHPLMAYSEPWGYYQMFTKKDGFTRNTPQAFIYNPVESKDMLRILEKSTKVDPTLEDTYVYNVSQAKSAQTALDTAIYRDPQGDLASYHWFNYYNKRKMTQEEEEKLWGYPMFYSMVLLNPDPDIPGYNRFSMSMDELTMPGFEGYQLDSLNEFGGQNPDNYRKEQYKYMDIPLTFGMDTKEPCSSHHFNSIEYLKKLREVADERGQKTIASNTWHPFITFSAPYLDYIGAGEANISPIPDRWFMAIREIVPYKVVSYLDYEIMVNDTKNILSVPFKYDENAKPETTTSKLDSISKKMERSLFWAIWPGTGNGWGDGVMVEKVRPAYRKYMPLYKALSEAGWEPVTQASVEDNMAGIERYGNFNKSDLYFAIRNYKEADNNILVKLDISKIKTSPANILVYDYKTLNQIKTKTNGKTLEFYVNTIGLETAVVKVTDKSQMNTFIKDQAKIYICNNMLQLIDENAFWSKEPDNIAIKNLVSKDLNALKNKKNVTIKDYKTFCDKYLKEINNISDGRSKEEALYTLYKVKQYLNM